MNIIEAMSKAAMIELLGGLFFTGSRRPILKKELVKHLANVRVNKGDKVYYHLNEETSVMTEFVLMKNNNYHYSQLEMPLSDVRMLVNRTETAKGFDFRKNRFRKSMWVGDFDEAI